MNKIIQLLYIACAFALPAINANGQSGSAAMKKADSLYFALDWVGAKKIYTSILKDTSHNSIAWNRLGFSNYNTGNYKEALNNYQKALTNKPIPPVKASAYSRMARINAIQNNADTAARNIDSAMVYGYRQLQ